MITFSDESQVFLGGKEVVARYLGRGHTNGDVVVYFPSERVLHMGDLFTNGDALLRHEERTAASRSGTRPAEGACLRFGHGDPRPWPGDEEGRSGEARSDRRGISGTRSQSVPGRRARDAAKRLDLSDMGFTVSAMVAGGVPGMCQELAQ